MTHFKKRPLRWLQELSEMRQDWKDQRLPDTHTHMRTPLREEVICGLIFHLSIFKWHIKGKLEKVFFDLGPIFLDILGV